MEKFINDCGEPLKTRFDLNPENLPKNLKYLSPKWTFDEFDNRLSQIVDIFKKHGQNWQMNYSKFKELEGKEYILDPESRIIVNNWTDIDEDNDTITIQNGWLCMIYDKNYRFSIKKTVKDLLKNLQK